MSNAEVKLSGKLACWLTMPLRAALVLLLWPGLLVVAIAFPKDLPIMLRSIAGFVVGAEFN